MAGADKPVQVFAATNVKITIKAVASGNPGFITIVRMFGLLTPVFSCWYALLDS